MESSVRRAIGSKPELHGCCVAARRYLRTSCDSLQWTWHFVDPFVRVRSGAQDPIVVYCPWCGEKLPERGRLRVTEVGDERQDG